MNTMGWLDWIKSGASGRQSEADTDTVRRIAGELERLDADQARYVAAFAYVLSRVARSDLKVSEVETAAMVNIVTRVARLPEAQAALAVEIAKNQSRLFGGTEDFLVTREFRDISTDAQRHELIHCLFSVAASEDGISAEEEGQIRQIASELGIPDDQYLAIRLKYRDQRTVMRNPDA
jgi:uncharacterized tellurite resistance protein B-like protein